MDQKSSNKLETFLKWCEDHGISSPKSELRYCGPDAGFGFFAKEVLRPNELVLEVL